jgi:hypothetical protein
VPERFRLYTDADIDGPVVKALQASGRDILRAVDAYPEGTDDETHFARAAQEGRVYLTNDQRLLNQVAIPWLAKGRTCRLIIWPRFYYDLMTPGDFVLAIEELEAMAKPFPGGYPIVHLKHRK